MEKEGEKRGEERRKRKGGDTGISEERNQQLS